MSQILIFHLLSKINHLQRLFWHEHVKQKYQLNVFSIDGLYLFLFVNFILQKLNVSIFIIWLIIQFG